MLILSKRFLLSAKSPTENAILKSEIRFLRKRICAAGHVFHVHSQDEISPMKPGLAAISRTDTLPMRFELQAWKQPLCVVWVTFVHEDGVPQAKTCARRHRTLPFKEDTEAILRKDSSEEKSQTPRDANGRPQTLL